MRKVTRARGWSAAGVLLLVCGASVAHARPTEAVRSHPSERAGNMSVKSVASALSGEWEGQIEVRAADGSLSTSLASMSAKPQADGNAVELYYEGFAFGKPVEGAMVLSYADNNEHASFRDNGAQIRGSCSPSDSPDDANGDSLLLSGRTEGRGREIRTQFSRHSPDSWSIQYQAKDQSGSWEPILTLRMDRMEHGQRSAAADGFNTAKVLSALRESVASASVDTDR